ncbi:MAG TPA: type II secretion system protein [Firmicutes bacterium]|nr:type II secretion system protein [Bacillota bacterium]
MVCKKRGITLIELLIAIFIVALISVMIISLMNLFSRSIVLFESKSNIIRMGNDSIDFVIMNLFESEHCVSGFGEFSYTGREIIFKIKEEEEDTDEFGVIYQDLRTGELKYVKVMIDEDGEEIMRSGIIIAGNVETFKAYFNYGIPEKSNFVYFSLILNDLSGTVPKYYIFSSGHYLRNVRLR